MPVNLVDAVGIEVRVDGSELVQVPEQKIIVTITNNLDGPVSGALAPKLPAGMSAKPRGVKFDLAARDETKSFTFAVTVGDRAPDGWLTLAAEAAVPGEATCRGELEVYKSFSDVLVSEGFEDGIGGSFGYTNAHYQVVLDQSSAKFGRQCLHVYDRGGARYGHVACFGRSFWPRNRQPNTDYVFDTNVYPIVDFWFKTDAKTDNLGLHVVLDNGEAGYGVLLNGFWVQQWVPRVMIGQADFTADGEWHHIVLNIDEMLDRELGDTSHFVREMLIGDTRTFASGWWYFFDAHHHFIDNFQIRRDPLPKGAKLEHRLASPTGAPMLSTTNPVPALDSEVVAGLKATLRLRQYGYMPWEPLEFDFYLTNCSDENVTVATWNRARLWEINVATAGGEPVTDGWVSAFWRPEQQEPPADTTRPPSDFGLPNEPKHFRELKPGETWREGMPIGELFANWADEHKKKLEWGTEYVVKLRYRSNVTGEQLGLAAWHGTVESNAVRLKLIAMPTPDEELAALGTSLDPVRRAKAAAQLGKAVYEPAIPALISALANDPDGDVRLNAAWALGNFPRLDPNNAEKVKAAEPVVAALITALDDKNWRVGEYAATALGRLGAAAATPSLTKRLASESVWIRRRTCDALREMADPSTVGALIELLQHDPSRDVRLAALEAVSRLYDARQQPVIELRNRVRQLDGQIGELDKRLAGLPEGDAQREGLTAQRDQAAKDRDEAAGKLGPLQAEFDGIVSAGNAALDDEFFLVRRNWLDQLVRRREATDLDIMALVIADLDDPHEVCRELAIRALGNYRDAVPPEAVARIVTLLGDRYDTVRRAAVETLPSITGKGLEELTGHDAAYWFRQFPRPARDPNERRGEAATQ